MLNRLVCCLLLLIVPTIARAQNAMTPPFYPPESSEAALMDITKPFLQMDEAKLIALVPPQSGFYFGDCPACDQGDQENQITWNLELGDKVQCKYCKTILPSPAYPENGQIEVTTPTGKKQIFKYYQDKNGKKYYLEGRRWYEQLRLVETAADALAQLYSYDKTKYAEAGRRAALLLKRCAEVYPDYIPHFDYPGLDKKFYTPEQVLAESKNVPDGAYRIAKWSWWAYMDISRNLLFAYDKVRNSEYLTDADRKAIENTLFSRMLDFVAQYDDGPLTNMHPTTWASQIVASRVLNRPEVAKSAIERMRRLIQNDFTYEGFWHEGTPSYHLQTAGGLLYDLQLLRPDLKGAPFDNWLNTEYPDLSRALKAVDAFRLPNGRYAAVHDSWAEQTYSPIIEASTPHLLTGMGYGILGMGSGDHQLQAHLNFSGRFGHVHYDSLNLLLFGQGKELVSDIGYSHTKARAWTMASVAHNTVLIDQLNQSTGELPHRTLGRLRLFNATDPEFQVVEAETPDAYPSLAKTYRRSLIAVQAPGGLQYVVDIFDVEGGSRHDWVLHGSADEPQTLELTDANGKPLNLQKVETLLPPNFEFKPLTTTGDYDFLTNGAWAFGNFRDIQSAKANDAIIATFRPTGTAPNGTAPGDVAKDGIGPAGLQTWIMGANGSTYTSARSWGVRSTGRPFAEDESKLDQHLREAVLVRRDENASRFVAVHVPFNGTSPVKNVTQLPLTPDGVALKIERAGGTDYILFGSDVRPRHGSDGTRQLAFDGRVALAQIDGNEVKLKMIDGTSLQVGTRKLAGTAPSRGNLIDATGNRFTVSGRFAAKAGDTIIMQHGDGRSSPFTIAKLEQAGANTVIETVEPPVFTGKGGEPLTMQTFPRLQFPAPHTVTSSILTISTKP